VLVGGHEHNVPARACLPVSPDRLESGRPLANDNPRIHADRHERARKAGAAAVFKFSGRGAHVVEVAR